MDNEIKIKILKEGVSLPAYATEGSAAADLRSAEDGAVTLNPGCRAMIHTGIAVSLGSPEKVALVFARSGLAVRHGICLANGVGVIDSDYTGEIIVGLLNTSDKAFTVEPGDRIAQLAIMPVIRGVFVPASELDATERGSGGFGSTGVK